MQKEEVRRLWSNANLAALWESPSAHKPPRAPDAPFKWSWDDLRPLLALAFEETSPAAIERRVLQLMSPHRKGEDEWTVGTIQAAIQCLKPGETARAHRHSMAAIRFMVEGDGVTTTVDGKDCPMEYGDLVLTPDWCWHGHRHEGTREAMWLDVLDVPLHNYLGTARFQPPPMVEVPPTTDDTVYSVPNILPEAHVGRRDHSPRFRYPYVDVVRALSGAPRSPDGARRVRYVNPLDGGSAITLLDCLMMQLDEGQQTEPFRENANALMMVVEGEGESMIGVTSIAWKPLDIITLPQWNYVSHRCTKGPARIFVVTDREVLRRLRVYHSNLKADEG